MTKNAENQQVDQTILFLKASLEVGDTNLQDAF